MWKNHNRFVRLRLQRCQHSSLPAPNIPTGRRTLKSWKGHTLLSFVSGEILMLGGVSDKIRKQPAGILPLSSSCKIRFFAFHTADGGRDYGSAERSGVETPASAGGCQVQAWGPWCLAGKRRLGGKIQRAWKRTAWSWGNKEKIYRDRQMGEWMDRRTDDR